jgi:hypothetical protein
MLLFSGEIFVGRFAVFISTTISNSRFRLIKEITLSTCAA